MLSTSTMRSSLYFHEKPDRFDQQAGPLADILDLHQDVRDRQASGTSSNSQGVYYMCTCMCTTHTRMYTYTQMYTHTHVRTHTHIRTHTHTHTYTHTQHTYTHTYTHRYYYTTCFS